MGFVNNARTNAAFVSVPEIVTLPRTSTAPSLGGWMTKFRVVPSTSIKPSHGEGGEYRHRLIITVVCACVCMCSLLFALATQYVGCVRKRTKALTNPPFKKNQAEQRCLVINSTIVPIIYLEERLYEEVGVKGTQGVGLHHRQLDRPPSMPRSRLQQPM